MQLGKQNAALPPLSEFIESVRAGCPGVVLSQITHCPKARELRAQPESALKSPGKLLRAP
eukprot:12218430-Alexandrium_andersonii.AAC.1